MNAFHDGLVRKLLVIPAEGEKRTSKQHHPPKRISNDAVAAVGELLRLFVHEARHRASIEAECEKEGKLKEGGSDGDDINDVVTIRADHLTKTAAGLLMDFS